VRRLAIDDIQQSLIDAALGQDSRARTIVQLLDVLRPTDPVLTTRIADTLARFGVAIIGNQIENPSDAAAIGRMSPLIHDHLRTHAPLLATVPRSAALAGGLRAGTGTLAGSGDGASVFRKLAQALLRTDLAQLRGDERTAAQHTTPLWVQRDALVIDG